MTDLEEKITNPNSLPPNKDQKNQPVDEDLFFPWRDFFTIAKFHAVVLIVTIGTTYFFSRMYVKELLINDNHEVLLSELKTYIELENQSLKNPLPVDNLCDLFRAKPYVTIVSLDKNHRICQNSYFLRTRWETGISEEQINFLVNHKSKKGTSTLANQEFLFAHYTYENKSIIIAKPLKLVTRLLKRFDQAVIIILIPLFIGVYIVLIYFGVRALKPIKLLAAKAQKLESLANPSSSPTKNAQFGVKDWQQVRSALSSTEESISQQLQQIQNEHRKNRVLLESITDGILAIDSDKKILFFNTRFSKKFLRGKNFSEEDQSNDLDLNKIFNDEDQYEIIEAFEDCLKDGEDRKVKEFTLLNQNRTLYYDIKINSIKLDDSESFGAVGVFHNVTESKLTEQMRVDFVANVSHEIRTPLTSIKGFGQVLQAQSHLIDSKAHHYLDKIILNAERLHTLFTDLLNLSVIESRNRLKKKEINLTQMVNQVKASLVQNYSNKEIEVEFDLPVDTIRVDPKLFEQVLINLIDNACKYGGSKAKVRVSDFLEGDNVIITISDNGPGISREHIGRIFERFYRVEQSRVKEDQAKGGTGLGLSIVKHIVTKHKGRIWAESEPEQGTIFFIELPYRKTPTPEGYI